MPTRSTFCGRSLRRAAPSRVLIWIVCGFPLLSARLAEDDTSSLRTRGGGELMATTLRREGSRAASPSTSPVPVVPRSSPLRRRPPWSPRSWTAHSFLRLPLRPLTSARRTSRVLPEDTRLHPSFTPVPRLGACTSRFVLFCDGWHGLDFRHSTRHKHAAAPHWGARAAQLAWECSWACAHTVAVANGHRPRSEPAFCEPGGDSVPTSCEEDILVVYYHTAGSEAAALATNPDTFSRVVARWVVVRRCKRWGGHE